MNAKLTPRQVETLRVLRDEFPIYSEECLEIKTKNEGIKKLVFNRVQKYLYESFEDQIRRKGWVRKIIVKGRQQTCSTLITGMFFHEAQFEAGTDVYIMSHETKSTKGLFGKIEMYNDTVRRDQPMLSHGTVVENRTEIEFTNKSTYSVGTAGEGNTGRSLTAKLFHGSEAAFWDKPEGIISGALQTVLLGKGTKIILESTANGMNWFYQKCIDARAGIGVYELIFIPWVWTDEYRLPLDPGEVFVRTPEESKIAEIMVNVHDWVIDDEQLNWRRAKVVELGERLFKQEYPNTFEEAFQYSGQPFIDMAKIYAAQQRWKDGDGSDLSRVFGANILGVDVGRNKFINPNSKPDRTVLIWRKGRCIHRKKIYETMRGTTLAGILCDIIDKGEADYIFIDRAVGEEAYDIMCERGYGRWITAVDFGGEAMDEQYANKRAEMICLFNDAVEEDSMIILDAQDICTDLSMLPYWNLNSNSRKVFPPKDKMREKFGRSPDIADATVLTYAFPVSAEGVDHYTGAHTRNTRDGSALAAQRQRQQSANSIANRRPGGYTEPYNGRPSPGRRYISS